MHLFSDKFATNVKHSETRTVTQIMKVRNIHLIARISDTVFNFINFLAPLTRVSFLGNNKATVSTMAYRFIISEKKLIQVCALIKL